MQDKFMSKQELNNYFKAMRELKVKCKCGHSVVMLPEYKYRICTFCGAKILPKREQFKLELRRVLDEI